MKKRPYLFLVTLSLIFILGNIGSFMPAIPMFPGSPSPAAPDNSDLQEYIDTPLQVEDDTVSEPQSKETEDAKVEEKHYQQTAVDPTMGSFEYNKSVIPYNWVDATVGVIIRCLNVMTFGH